MLEKEPKVNNQQAADATDRSRTAGNQINATDRSRRFRRWEKVSLVIHLFLLHRRRWTIPRGASCEKRL